MIIRKKIREYTLYGACPKGSVLVCPEGLRKFFDLGKTRLGSWDILSSDKPPKSGNVQYVYKTRKYYGEHFEYRNKHGRYEVGPYLLWSTRAALEIGSGIRYVWLEYRGRG